MKKVYDVLGDVVKAKGLMVWPYRKAKVEGVLILEADAGSFVDPIGKEFTISGELTKVTDRKGRDVTEKLGDNLALKPVKHVMDSLEVYVSVAEKVAEGKVTGSISLDFSTIENIQLQAKSKGAARFAVREVVIDGAGTYRAALSQ